MKRKKKKTVFERLRDWDEGSFDLTDRIEYYQPIPDPEEPERPENVLPQDDLRPRVLRGLRRVYPWLAGVLGLMLSAFLLLGVLELPPFGAADNPPHNEVMDRYVGQGLEETGAVNTVAGVILDYRAFDTLGESHVLFTAACAVLILLLSGGAGDEEPLKIRNIMEKDPILMHTARILAPIVLLFGIYVVLNGHLGPGGGFAGGAILGGALILCAIAFGFESVGRLISARRYRICITAGLCFYSVAKCYSFYCGANHLETVFTTGTPGAILSAGLILPLNIAVGLVVALTMYGFCSVFQRGRI